MRWITEHFYSPFIPWRLLGGLFLSVVVIVVYYLVQFSLVAPPIHPNREAYTLAVVSILYAFALALLCFKGTRPFLKRARFLPRTSLYLSPPLVGMAIAVFGIGQVIWLGQMLIFHKLSTYPGLDHYTQLGIYPFLMAAILLLPSRNLSRFSRLRIFLDSLLIMVAITTLCYYFLLAPLLVHGDGTFLEKLVCGIYLDGDLVLAFCLLLVMLRSGNRRLRPVLILLGCAIISFFLTHFFHTYELLYHGYNDFSNANIGWPIAGVLLVGAAQTVNIILNSGEVTGQTSSELFDADYGATRRKKVALPAFLVLIFSLLIFAVWLSGAESFSGQKAIVYGGGFVLLILMVLRQLLTLDQISSLQRQLQIKNRSLSILNTHLEAQATRDALTGLPNHRTVVEKLDEALEKARASKGNCAVIFMDVDDFKNINDRYGHLTGDTVLSNFAILVKSGLRAGDWVGRWGGEEFVAILPQTEPLEALNLAESLRKRIDRHVLAGNGEVHVTCSLGVACYPQDAGDREGLLTRADQAMYASKRLGRNQTRTAHEPLVLAMNLSEPELRTGTEGDPMAVVNALMALLETRDLPTGQHMRRVAELSRKLALALGLSDSEAQLVSLGGLLHDLGKLAIPDAILGKRERLNEAERATILQHPIAGAAILQPIHALHAVAPIVHAHHEQMDGSGYPDGLKGEESPLGARIVAVADAYDAMTSERAYHSPSPSTEALQALQRGAGSQFDPRVVETLARLLTTNSNLSDVA